MRCPSTKRLAAASLGADPRAELHAETCERCRAELVAMAEIGAFARRAPVRLASEDRRARIAALVMASSDKSDEMVAGAPARRSRASLAMIVIAAAAVAAVVVWRVRPAEYAIAWPVLQVPAAVPAPGLVRESAPALAPEIARTSTSAPVPTNPAPDVPAAPQRIQPRSVTPSSRVFAGSQEEGTPDISVTRDQVTLAPPPPPPPPSIVVPPFERGWTAMRAQRYADAIAAFDLATAPAVVEDAAYWAAIASARAGDRADASRRLTAFVAKFPGSARIADARALLARLAP